VKRHFPAILTVALIGVSVLGGCGGKLAETGSATVTGLSYGIMRLHHPNGKVNYKRLLPDKMPKDARTVARNIGKPARYVQTKKGGTLTFPNGDTVIYQDHKLKKPESSRKRR
jgi:hypothetical protein